jgi:hypothetical protein
LVRELDAHGCAIIAQTSLEQIIIILQTAFVHMKLVDVWEAQYLAQHTRVVLLKEQP